MKSIILFAVLAVAVSAIRIDDFNQTAYHLGFFSVSGFSSAQLQDAISCSGNSSFNNSIAIEFKNIYLAKTRGANAITNAAVNSITAARALAAKDNCKAYVNDLQGAFWGNTTDVSQLTQLIWNNYNQYKDTVDSEISSWGLLLLSKDAYGAGNTAAHVFEVLLGKARQPHKVYEPKVTKLPTSFRGLRKPYLTMKNNHF